VTGPRPEKLNHGQNQAALAPVRFRCFVCNFFSRVHKLCWIPVWRLARSHLSNTDSYACSRISRAFSLGGRVAPLSARQKFQLFAGETLDPSAIGTAAAHRRNRASRKSCAQFWGRAPGPYAQRFWRYDGECSLCFPLLRRATTDTLAPGPSLFQKKVAAVYRRAYCTQLREPW